PSSTGSFANLEAEAPVSLESAADIFVAAAITTAGRDVLLRADPAGSITLSEAASLSATDGDVTLVAANWTNLAGEDALDVIGGGLRVYTASPLNDDNGGLELRERFGVSYPADPVVSGNVYYYTASLIAGRVFIDADLNGVLGSTEVGIPGVSVAISGAGAGGADLQVVTDSQGAYRFIGLPTGVHTLWVSTPERQLADYVAVDEGTREVQLSGGGVVRDVDFAFYQGA